jgi:tetratricopeptide (TPR) repeat protein
VLCHEVWALWFLGKLDRAKRLSDDILAQLPDHGHATTIAFCTLYGAVFPAIFAHDFDYAARLGEDLAAYCTKRKMGPHYATAGRLCSYVGLGMREPSPATIEAIRCDLDSLHNRFGVYVLDSPLTAALAQILLTAGEPAAAEAVLQDGITFAENSGERYWLSELHRLQGRVRQKGRSDPAAAMDCFTKAMEIAKRQEARPLELRAATDLVRFRQATGSCGDAQAILAPLLSSLEGGDTAFDVQNARALLEVGSSVIDRPRVPSIASA